MTTDVPASATERWDEIAEKVRRAKGKWVLIGDGARMHNRTIRENLERRGLIVEVTSRMGYGVTTKRPWVGWRTWVRDV